MKDSSLTTVPSPLARVSAIALLCCLQACVGMSPEPEGEASNDRLDQIQERYQYIGSDGYRMDHYHAPTPSWVPNATTIDTEQLIALIDEKNPALVDVVKANFRPARDGLSAAWLPTQRRNIPGSIWLPNVGFGVISDQFDVYFRRELRKATGGKQNNPLVFYCRTDCWASWNAVQRAARYGYDRLYWYPTGADGWEFDGGELVDAIPIPVE